MKLNWFTRKGIIYWPASIAGWAILILAAAFAIYSFIDIVLTVVASGASV